MILWVVVFANSFFLNVYIVGWVDARKLSDSEAWRKPYQDVHRLKDEQDKNRNFK
jgi:hypothetical protein